MRPPLLQFLIVFAKRECKFNAQSLISKSPVRTESWLSVIIDDGECEHPLVGLVE
jgi:hypothetical protein